MFLPGDSPQLRCFFFLFSFIFVNVATLIKSSSRGASIHENTITCSALYLRASSERDKRAFGSMELWAARNWPQLLGSEASTYPTKCTLLDVYKQMHPARQNDLHEHEPTSRLDLISCVCKVWQAVWKPAYICNNLNLGAFFLRLSFCPSAAQTDRHLEIEGLALPQMYLKKEAERGPLIKSPLYAWCVYLHFQRKHRQREYLSSIFSHDGNIAGNLHERIFYSLK